VKLSTGETVEMDDVLVCVGRRPEVEGLRPTAAGLVTDRGRLPVNEYMQTNQPHIYGVGDVNGLSLLAHAASAQAEVAVDHILGKPRPYDNARVPRCLYTWPEVASVGEWVHTAAGDVKTQRFFFQGSPKALVLGETEGFVQIVSAKNGGQILGAQIVGPHATELIHIFSVALHSQMTGEDLRRVIFAHPTLAENINGALSR
jgi:dihydrolipoamide dehydrogenase